MFGNKRDHKKRTHSNKMCAKVVTEKHTKFAKIFLMVLTNQLIYLVNVKTMRFFQITMCASQKIPNFKSAAKNF